MDLWQLGNNTCSVLSSARFTLDSHNFGDKTTLLHREKLNNLWFVSFSLKSFQIENPVDEWRHCRTRMTLERPRSEGVRMSRGSCGCRWSMIVNDDIDLVNDGQWWFMMMMSLVGYHVLRSYVLWQMAKIEFWAFLYPNCFWPPFIRKIPMIRLSSPTRASTARKITGEISSRKPGTGQGSSSRLRPWWAKYWWWSS